MAKTPCTMESLISSIVASYLKDYIRNFKKEQMGLNFLRGKSVIRDIDVNVDTLNDSVFASMPSLRFARILINTLSIDVPFMSLKSKPIVAYIDEVFVEVVEVKDIPPRTDQTTAPSASSYGFFARVGDSFSFEVNKAYVALRTLGKYKTNSIGIWTPPTMLLEIQGLRYCNTNHVGVESSLEECFRVKKGRRDTLFVYKKVATQKASLYLINPNDWFDVADEITEGNGFKAILTKLTQKYTAEAEQLLFNGNSNNTEDNLPKTDYSARLFSGYKLLENTAVEVMLTYRRRMDNSFLIGFDINVALPGIIRATLPQRVLYEVIHVIIGVYNAFYRSDRIKTVFGPDPYNEKSGSLVDTAPPVRPKSRTSSDFSDTHITNLVLGRDEKKSLQALEADLDKSGITTTVNEGEDDDFDGLEDVTTHGGKNEGTKEWHDSTLDSDVDPPHMRFCLNVLMHQLQLNFPYSSQPSVSPSSNTATNSNVGSNTEKEEEGKREGNVFNQNGNNGDTFTPRTFHGAQLQLFGFAFVSLWPEMAALYEGVSQYSLHFCSLKRYEGLNKFCLFRTVDILPMNNEARRSYDFIRGNIGERSNNDIELDGMALLFRQNSHFPAPPCHLGPASSTQTLVSSIELTSDIDAFARLTSFIAGATDIRWTSGDWGQHMYSEEMKSGGVKKIPGRIEEIIPAGVVHSTIGLKEIKVIFSPSTSEESGKKKNTEKISSRRRSRSRSRTHSSGNAVGGSLNVTHYSQFIIHVKNLEVISNSALKLSYALPVTGCHLTLASDDVKEIHLEEKEILNLYPLRESDLAMQLSDIAHSTVNDNPFSLFRPRFQATIGHISLSIVSDNPLYTKEGDLSGNGVNDSTRRSSFDDMDNTAKSIANSDVRPLIKPFSVMYCDSFDPHPEHLESLVAEFDYLSNPNTSDYNPYSRPEGYWSHCRRDARFINTTHIHVDSFFAEMSPVEAIRLVDTIEIFTVNVLRNRHFKEIRSFYESRQVKSMDTDLHNDVLGMDAQSDTTDNIDFGDIMVNTDHFLAPKEEVIGDAIIVSDAEVTTSSKTIKSLDDDNNGDIDEVGAHDGDNDDSDGSVSTSSTPTICSLKDIMDADNGITSETIEIDIEGCDDLDALNRLDEKMEDARAAQKKKRSVNSENNDDYRERNEPVNGDDGDDDDAKRERNSSVTFGLLPFIATEVSSSDKDNDDSSLDGSTHGNNEKGSVYMERSEGGEVEHTEPQVRLPADTTVSIQNDTDKKHDKDDKSRNGDICDTFVPVIESPAKILTIHVSNSQFSVCAYENKFESGAHIPHKKEGSGDTVTNSRLDEDGTVMNVLGRSIVVGLEWPCRSNRKHGKSSVDTKDNREGLFVINEGSRTEEQGENYADVQDLPIIFGQMHGFALTGGGWPLLLIGISDLEAALSNTYNSTYSLPEARSGSSANGWLQDAPCFSFRFNLMDTNNKSDHKSDKGAVFLDIMKNYAPEDGYEGDDSDTKIRKNRRSIGGEEDEEAYKNEQRRKLRLHNASKVKSMLSMLTTENIKIIISPSPLENVMLKLLSEILLCLGPVAQHNLGWTIGEKLSALFLRETTKETTEASNTVNLTNIMDILISIRGKSIDLSTIVLNAAESKYVAAISSLNDFRSNAQLAVLHRKDLGVENAEDVGSIALRAFDWISTQKIGFHKGIVPHLSISTDNIYTHVPLSPSSSKNSHSGTSYTLCDDFPFELEVLRSGDTSPGFCSNVNIQDVVSHLTKENFSESSAILTEAFSSLIAINKLIFTFQALLRNPVPLFYASDAAMLLQSDYSRLATLSSSIQNSQSHSINGIGGMSASTSASSIVTDCHSANASPVPFMTDGFKSIASNHYNNENKDENDNSLKNNGYDCDMIESTPASPDGISNIEDNDNNKAQGLIHRAESIRSELMTSYNQLRDTLIELERNGDSLMPGHDLAEELCDTMDRMIVQLKTVASISNRGVPMYCGWVRRMQSFEKKKKKFLPTRTWATLVDGRIMFLAQPYSATVDYVLSLQSLTLIEIDTEVTDKKTANKGEKAIVSTSFGLSNADSNTVFYVDALTLDEKGNWINAVKKMLTNGITATSSNSHTASLESKPKQTRTQAITSGMTSGMSSMKNSVKRVFNFGLGRSTTPMQPVSETPEKMSTDEDINNTSNAIHMHTTPLNEHKNDFHTDTAESTPTSPEDPDKDGKDNDNDKPYLDLDESIERCRTLVKEMRLYTQHNIYTPQKQLQILHDHFASVIIDLVSLHVDIVEQNKDQQTTHAYKERVTRALTSQLLVQKNANQYLSNQYHLASRTNAELESMLRITNMHNAQQMMDHAEQVRTLTSELKVLRGDAGGADLVSVLQSEGLPSLSGDGGAMGIKEFVHHLNFSIIELNEELKESEERQGMLQADVDSHKMNQLTLIISNEYMAAEREELEETHLSEVESLKRQLQEEREKRETAEENERRERQRYGLLSSKMESLKESFQWKEEPTTIEK